MAEPEDLSGKLALVLMARLRSRRTVTTSWIASPILFLTLSANAFDGYEPFEGVCLVDTFETAETAQSDFEKALFNEANAARVERQKKAPIKVIISNPLYNAWQQDEMDNNRNRKYKTIDKRVRETYGADSVARNKNSLADPYIKALRWASDRIGSCGIICFVSNNAFVDSLSCDGVRKNLAEEFDSIHILDLGGNVRKSPKLSGTTHNVFGIQVREQVRAARLARGSDETRG